ncbi:hypothetical protein Poli38472_004181 [Pythium oligandrum]|uniref:PH domain-containing protein n=1 Tax=Pythium oligandrum TaxID=41045 RepID=A0A8K1CPL8_PYTOL|nr:hypothetical protein Poli38472_004181 [Pythium oligandrum]|eukprot:TMW66416.1 hypothetical protein Poli38472_004181 [Pythium oligandrum]
MIRKSRSSLSLSVLSSSTASTSSTKSALSCRSSFLASTILASDPVEGWMYWQRDEANAHCWTKVYGVVQNELLWFFRGEKTARNLLMQIAVASVEESGDRQLRIVDPNGEGLVIYLVDPSMFSTWRQRLQEAAEVTSQYFDAFEISVKDLPRNSIYRGSLVSDRRVKKRTRCKVALMRLMHKWRSSLPPDDRSTF